MWESCKVGMLKKNKECYVFNAFRLFLRQLKLKLSNPNTVQNGRLYVVFSFYTTTCIVIFCSLLPFQFSIFNRIL